MAYGLLPFIRTFVILFILAKGDSVIAKFCLTGSLNYTDDNRKDLEEEEIPHSELLTNLWVCIIQFFYNRDYCTGTETSRIQFVVAYTHLSKESNETRDMNYCEPSSILTTCFCNQTMCNNEKNAYMMLHNTNIKSDSYGWTNSSNKGHILQCLSNELKTHIDQTEPENIGMENITHSSSTLMIVNSTESFSSTRIKEILQLQNEKVDLPNKKRRSLKKLKQYIAIGVVSSGILLICTIFVACFICLRKNKNYIEEKTEPRQKKINESVKYVSELESDGIIPSNKSSTENISRPFSNISTGGQSHLQGDFMQLFGGATELEESDGVTASEHIKHAKLPVNWPNNDKKKNYDETANKKFKINGNGKVLNGKINKVEKEECLT